MNQNDPNMTGPSYQALQAVADLVETAGRLTPSSVIIPGGTRIEDLRLVDAARDQGIVERVWLVGEPSRVQDAAAAAEVELSPEDIIPADSEDAIARATVQHIASGEVDVILKGNISTAVMNRHMLGMAERTTVTLTTIFDAASIAQGRPMLLTDAGFTTICNFGRLVDMIGNAVDVARTVMGIARPRVAVLSANEKQIPSLPSTRLGLELSQRHWPDAVVCGPLSFDLATSRESVSIKGMPDLPGAQDVAGRADILVCPSIDAANILYKAIAALTQYGLASLAGVTVGFPIPYVILSRSDSLETRLNSVALSCVYAQRRKATPSSTRTTTAVASPAAVRRVLTVHPKSTSIRVAVFDDDQCTCGFEIPRTASPDAPTMECGEDIERVTRSLCNELEQRNMHAIQAVSVSGGVLPRVQSEQAKGTYWVAEPQGPSTVAESPLVPALLKQPETEPGSHLGIQLCAALARHFGIPGFMVDPIVVDEFSPQAKISGYRPIERQGGGHHDLSILMASQRAAQAVGRGLGDINLVVTHLDDDMTIASVCRGSIVDCHGAMLGTGPFSPCRTGQLPLEALIDLCYSGEFTREDLLRELTLCGGLNSYLGEARMDIIEQRIAQGDREALKIVEAMVYQIAKGIGSAFVAAGCDVEAIVLTGSLARSPMIRNAVRKRVARLAPVLVFQESLDMVRLAQGARDVLAGQTKAKHYNWFQNQFCSEIERKANGQGPR